jgi:uncharacterized FlaG/YvyC family protein
MTTTTDSRTTPMDPMPLAQMPIEPIQPPLYPVLSAPGAVAALRATTGVQLDKTSVDETDRTTALNPADAAEPPTAALEAVQVASEAFEQLRRNGRELHFEQDDNGVMRIDVYDGTGELLRSIPPNEALAIASGEASWRA